MRIDVQTHYMPEAYVKALEARTDFPRMESTGGKTWAWGTEVDKLPMPPSIFDLSVKLKEMDENGVDLSLLSLNIPGPDLAKKPAVADELARIGNDGIAEAVSRHPGRFRGVANLGFGSIEASCRELERCMDDLGFVGLQVFAYIGGKRPVDDPAFAPLWALLAERGVPLVLHPGPSPSSHVYQDFWLGPLVGFLFDESLATLRLILSGVMERLPDLKVLLPHAGATLPLLMARVDYLTSIHPGGDENLTQPPSGYFRRVYTDAVAHSKAALELAVREMGPERIMFATDSPWVPIKNHVKLVESLGLSAEETDRIWSGTAKEFFGL
ncbi:MAG: amidohydrolase family protein [bacterium]|nr:amidohydrolase family protein [bacterium]